PPSPPPTKKATVIRPHKHTTKNGAPVLQPHQPSPAFPSKPTTTPSPKGMAAWPRWKRYSITGLFATVIISGAVWGAMLKMRVEAQSENKKILEATTDEKVLILEQRREHLVKQKKELDDKLADLHARMKARESG
ncbi:hypothetical protein B0T18DRAFT_292623, partial [Schizothecium vesticola]